MQIIICFTDSGGFGSSNNRKGGFGKKSFGDDRGGMHSLCSFSVFSIIIDLNLTMFADKNIFL